MLIYVDIDGTICNTTGLDYESAEPVPKMIEVVNSWYNDGHEITYWTARGRITGRDWSEVTMRQLREWGCKFHILSFEKPVYDLIVDDKSMHPDMIGTSNEPVRHYGS